MWGAQGGTGAADGSLRSGYGGKGGYSSGKIILNKDLNLYIYVGGAGANGVAGTSVNGGWNGGGKGSWDHSDDESCGGGGGATDIRLTNGNWDNFNSLKSRIMVAGAGGGGAYHTRVGGYGGGLSGGNPTEHEYIGSGTQTTGYKFGQGQNGIDGVKKNVCAAGSGSGYYGGYSNQKSDVDSAEWPASGGSGFISGHTGCNAINQNSTSTKITHTGQPNHYSGYIFTNTVMKAGDESMPSPTGGTETGQSGNGNAKITWMPVL